MATASEQQRQPSPSSGTCYKGLAAHFGLVLQIRYVAVLHNRYETIPTGHTGWLCGNERQWVHTCAMGLIIIHQLTNTVEHMEQFPILAQRVGNWM